MPAFSLQSSGLFGESLGAISRDSLGFGVGVVELRRSASKDGPKLLGRRGSVLCSIQVEAVVRSAFYMSRNVSTFVSSCV